MMMQAAADDAAMVLGGRPFKASSLSDFRFAHMKIMVELAFPSLLSTYPPVVLPAFHSTEYLNHTTAPC